MHRIRHGTRIHHDFFRPAAPRAQRVLSGHRDHRPRQDCLGPPAVPPSRRPGCGRGSCGSRALLMYTTCASSALCAIARSLPRRMSPTRDASSIHGVSLIFCDRSGRPADLFDLSQCQVVVPGLGPPPVPRPCPGRRDPLIACRNPTAPPRHQPVDRAGAAPCPVDRRGQRLELWVSSRHN
jgi:hypothetical protein